MLVEFVIQLNLRKNHQEGRKTGAYLRFKYPICCENVKKCGELAENGCQKYVLIIRKILTIHLFSWFFFCRGLVFRG